MLKFIVNSESALNIFFNQCAVLINIGLSSKTNTQTKHMEDTVSSITKRMAYFSADCSNSDLILSSLVQNISLNGHNYGYRARV